MVVRFPDDYPTHSAEQTFYFNQQGLLKRLNYVVDILGGGPAAGGAHYCFDHYKVGESFFRRTVACWDATRKPRTQSLRLQWASK